MQKKFREDEKEETFVGKKRERDIYAYLGPSRGFRAVVVATHQTSDDLLKRMLSISDRPAHYFIRDECVYVYVCVCV